MRMRRDLASEPVRVGHDGLHLLKRILRRLRIVAMRKHAAGSANFDQVRTVLDDLAGLVLDGFNAIGHAFILNMPLKRQQIVVAVATRDTQRRAADQHARSGDVAGINRIAQGNVRKPARPHVADGRKTGFERDAGIARSVQSLAWH